MIQDWRGKRVTVMGLGFFEGGIGAARWLAEHGADVLVTDLKSEEELRPSIERLEGLPLRWRLGGHHLDDFTGAEVVVVSPAVPKSSPYLAAAEKAGRVITSEMILFFEHCRSRILAVTGSNGKSTTAQLVHDCLKAQWPRTRLGGNIGRSLLAELADMRSDDWVVLELSSFQLEDLGRESLGPDLAVVTNLSPNHLDRHGNMEHYAEAKRNIVRHLRSGGVAVLNQDDAAVWGWRNGIGHEVCGFGSRQMEGSTRAYLSDGWLNTWEDERPAQILRVGDFPLPGEHNRSNALAAAAAARVVGVPVDTITAVFRSFRGLPHRMELVGERNGARYYNDSKATTPEAAFAALSSFPQRVILLAGGYDKKLDVGHLGEAIAGRAKLAILMGQSAGLLEEAIREAQVDGGPVHIRRAASLEEAVELAALEAEEGDVVLLSPGFASYGMFNNYEERGERFRACVARGVAD